jgi:anti-anti-sigma factor
MQQRFEEKTMTIDVDTRENDAIVTVSGDVDMLVEPELSRLERGLREKQSILFDVSGLNHFDATFLRFLIRLHDHANSKAPATIELTGVSSQLQRILEVTGLTSKFPVRPSRWIAS